MEGCRERLCFPAQPLRPVPVAVEAGLELVWSSVELQEDVPGHGLWTRSIWSTDWTGGLLAPSWVAVLRLELVAPRGLRHTCVLACI